MTSPGASLTLGRGKPLVVIPGISGRDGAPAWVGRRMLRQQIVALARHREVTLVDRRPGLESETSMARLADDYADRLARRFDGPVDVLGMSTGGSIALQLAADHPNAVDRLVLVSAAFRLSEAGREIQARTAALVRDGRSRSAAAAFLGTTGGRPAARRLRHLAGYLAPAFVVGKSDADFLTTLDAEDGFDLRHRLGDISSRTLIAGGELDGFYSPALFEATADGLRDGEVVIHRGAGHLALQGNRRLTREVIAFLDRP